MNLKYKLSAKRIFTVILLLIATIISVACMAFINLESKLNKVNIDKKQIVNDVKYDQEKSLPSYINNIALL